jgi:hypothetical protein
MLLGKPLIAEYLGGGQRKKYRCTNDSSRYEERNCVSSSKKIVSFSHFLSNILVQRNAPKIKLFAFT